MTQLMCPADMLLCIRRETAVEATAQDVFASILDQLGHANRMPDGTPFPMHLEPWPGGRWFRDLGPGVGHLWGHVQVIKPPTLLEIHGPLFMSYAAISHVQYRVTDQGDRCTLAITHRAFGELLPEHREGVVMGWESLLKQISLAATGKSSPAAHRI